MIARSTCVAQLLAALGEVHHVSDAGPHGGREQPVPRLVATITMAVIGAVRPMNSARPSASGSFTSGASTSTFTGSSAATRISSAAVTLWTQPMSSGSTSSARARVDRNVWAYRPR